MEGVVVMFFMLGISLSHLVTGNAQDYFDVGKFGAVGDGNTDDSPAFLKAWQAVCGASGENATLEIAANRTFLLYPVQFNGPCKPRYIHIKVPISERPTALHFHLCTDLRLHGLTHLNSQKNHISIYNCSGVLISDLNIIAPSDSPNTDGIDIALSSQLLISNTFIGTGDDCVAINGGTSNINITSVTCGPGHGISIGSLGEGETNENVDQVHVTGCTFNRTMNGARIKTIPGGTGFARDISFEEITLIASGNPIVIDQHYCNGHGHHCQDQEKAIAVSNVTFRGFRGTSAAVEAINLDCSKQGCRGITIDNINISSSVGKDLRVVCNNAYGTTASTVPEVSCLSS
ncbi:hypothetical protein V6N13_057805 [Hibiscus sabdariffa]